MYTDKENVHPNIAHLLRQKRSIQEWSRSSGKMSKVQVKKGNDDWRRRIMCPSFREKQVEEKLVKMLNSQKSVKDCVHTALSEQKMVRSFNSNNHTLQKYFQQEHSPAISEQHTNKKDIIDIWHLVTKLTQMRSKNVEALSESQILQKIKKNLETMINDDTSKIERE